MGAPASRSGSRPTGGAAGASPAKPSIPSADSPQLSTALELCDAIGANVRLSMDAMYWLRDIAASMRQLGIMQPIADDLTHIGKQLYESAKDVSAAHARSTTASIRAQEQTMGETLMALLDNARGEDA